MESLLDVAHGVLARHPSPALPYTELHRLICAERPGPPPDPGFLLRRIRARRDLFRVVEPWRGPWRRLFESDGEPAGAYREALDAGGAPVDVWIVPTAEDAGSPEACPPRSLAERVRATLLDLGRRVDPESPTALARWVRLLVEQRSLAPRLEGG